MSEQDFGLVLYFDGGSHTPKGLASWGVHGYKYTNEVPKQGSGCPKAIPTKNGYQAKAEGEIDDSEDRLAYPPVSLVEYYDAFGNVLQDGTNNVGELMGLVTAFQLALKLKPKELTLFGDSRYVIDGLTKWSINWVKNNWIKSDGAVVENKSIWVTVLDLKQQIDAAGIKWNIQWVKGHSGDTGNDKADELATIGLIFTLKGMCKSEEEITPAKGYWNKSFSYNRMIEKTSWCFNSNHPNAVVDQHQMKPSGHYVYHLSDHGPDDSDLAKPIADSSMSVLYLKEPVKELTLVKEFQNTLNTDNYQTLVVAKISKILTAKVANVLEKYKSDILLKHERVRNVLLMKSLLTEERNPAQLAFRAVERFNHLEQILDNYLEDPAKYKLSVTDLTHLFYSVDISGKKEVNKLVSGITTSTKKVNVKAKYDTLADSGEIDVPLLVGIDTPSRNAMAALAENNPTFHLVTWRDSDKSFRYATVLRSGDDIGIWAGVYANLRLLTSKF